MELSHSRIIEELPKTMVEPIFAFPDQDEFVKRLAHGAVVELVNEKAILQRENERGYKIQAWPIAPLPGLKTSFVQPWLFLVKKPLEAEVIFPSMTDRFRISLDAPISQPEGSLSLTALEAARVLNPYEDQKEVSSFVQNCAAFKIDIPRSMEIKDGSKRIVEIKLPDNFQVAEAIDDFQSIKLDKNLCQPLIIEWSTQSPTFDAEIAALRRLTEFDPEGDGPSHKARCAFEMIQNFHRIKEYYNLHADFPHLRNPAMQAIPPLIMDKFSRFNRDQRAAFDALARMPYGLHFVNGCPGAGKTEWNMIVSGLIHSGQRVGSNRRFSPILFLVDINETVTQAADRYQSLCQAANLPVKVVRMYGWPHEVRNSDKVKSAEETQASRFTREFLTAAGLARQTTLKRDKRKAPTLDEAAWEYFDRYQGKALIPLKDLLEKMESGQALSNKEQSSFKGLVSSLYRSVLSKIDFLATTPVAASGNFSKFFKPDIVFMDEAPHARELTSLIPLAYYNPSAWIFTGDVNQTRPFVKSGSQAEAAKLDLTFNPYAEQLRLSTMARAEASGALKNKLLVNNRARGNLHRLPSRMFYQSEMISGLGRPSRYPPSTMHLQGYLDRLNDGKPVYENRLVVTLRRSQEEERRNSFWNPVHQEWVIRQTKFLLSDGQFRSAGDPREPGTILIEAPYRTAFVEYQSIVKTWPKKWQTRVLVLTVDKAQGCEADVVFLDMVRTTKVGFMDDRFRLNVAITRARQAEIILMHPGAVSKNRRQRSTYVSQVWDDAKAKGYLSQIGATDELCQSVHVLGF